MCCTDCDGIDLSGSIFHTHAIGNGKCNECHGTGKKRTVIDDIGDGFGKRMEYEDGSDDCWECNGTRKCQTCGGDGTVVCDDDGDIQSEDIPELDCEQSDVELIEHGDNISSHAETSENTEEDTAEDDGEDDKIDQCALTSQGPILRTSDGETRETIETKLGEIVRDVINSRAGKIGVGIAALVLAEHLTSSEGRPGVITKAVDELDQAVQNHVRLMKKMALAALAVLALVFFLALIAHFS
jgi:hypothetical protein